MYVVQLCTYLDLADFLLFFLSHGTLPLGGRLLGIKGHCAFY